MRLAGASAVLGFMGGVAIFACGGSGGGGSASNASGFEQQFCSLIQPCCAQAGLTSNPSQCEVLIGAFTASAGYDASEGQACIAGVQAESGGATFCTTLGNDVPACNHVFSTAGGGTEGPGQPCTKDSDCASAANGSATCFNQTTFLDGGGTTQTASCVQTQTGKAGDGPCIGTRDGDVTYYSFGNGAPPGMAYVCDETQGSTCDGTTMKCTALGATGQTCTGDMTCVSGDYCAFVDGGQQCTARLADGASCASQPSGCLTGSYCDSTSRTCIAGLANGATCTTSQQCSSSSCVNGKCSGSNNLGLALYCG